MFSSLGLFQTLRCPDRDNCPRVQCLFSHRADLPPPTEPKIPVGQPLAAPIAAIPPSSQLNVPAKRHSASASKGVNSTVTHEPPRKLQKLNAGQKSTPPTPSTSTGAPILRVNAAQSTVAIPVRQTMLKSLYDHFVVLYAAILPSNPTLASEHALRQEAEVYKQSNKHTYRNAVITSIATLKRRPLPDSQAHPSVGTEGDIRTREESRKPLDAISLTPDLLEPLLLAVSDMLQWGYILRIPDGEGGHKPNDEGTVRKCQRCPQSFRVNAKPAMEQCLYHWGRPFTKVISGEKTRIYSCCSKPTAEAEGCVRGPHVFCETDAVELHSRHPFSRTVSAETTKNTVLDVVALDCEMIYTTAGMSVARVSVVDGTGKEVFDEFVRMSENVEVIDYNSRFSGITEANHKSAVLTLSSIRSSLDAYIDSDTIIIGHALENDLKTLRMIHERCVDTAILFPHRGGHPYRRALRDLVKEHLGSVIQSGEGTSGHSSVEDSIATLDLVRWYVTNMLKDKAPPDSRGSTTVSNRVS